MPRQSSLPVTFAGLPAYDDATCIDTRIAVRELLARGGVTCFQLFNLMRGLAVKGALTGLDFVAVVPERDVANLTSHFAARQILNFMGVAAHSGQFS